MATIVTRAGKGSPLTHDEVDANFNNLNGDKYEAGDSPSFATVTATEYYGDGSNLTGIPAGYTDADVDTHLNTSTATTGEFLSWNGSDYDWASVPAGYSDSDVDTHLNTSSATTDQILSWDGSDYAWVDQSSAETSLLNYNFTATAGQTTFSGTDDNSATLSYTQQNLIVTLNGIVLEDGTDYTATNGTSIVLATGAAAGDELNVVAFKSFTTADMVPASTGGTFSGNVTVDGVLTVDRATSDGMLVDFQKDGTSVGQVGAKLGYLTVGTGISGVLFNDDFDRMHPWNLNTNSSSDGTMDLGAPTERWDNLYLSGGVYLGGTGAANLLDDYEEGTFTPTLVSSGTDPVFTYSKQEGKYRKVGNTVLVNIDIRWSAHTQGNGTLYVAGIPFASGNMYSTAAVGEHSAAWGYGSGYTTMSVETANSTSIYPLVSGSGRNTSGIPADALAAQSGYIIFSLMYSTD